MTSSTIPIQREVVQVVTVFLKFKNKYLILHRNSSKKIDPNTLNGVGGRMEIGESSIDTAVRETIEETGYKIAPDDLVFSGVLSLYNGYATDFVVTFFTAHVPDDQIPHGSHTDDGNLHWMSYKAFVDSPIEKCDDLHYIFDDIHENKKFVGSAVFNEEIKIVKFIKHYLTL